MKPVVEGYRKIATYSVVMDRQTELQSTPSIKTEQTETYIQVLHCEEAVASVIIDIKRLNGQGYPNVGIILETHEMTLDLKEAELTRKERVLYNALVREEDWQVSLQTVMIHKFPLQIPWGKAKEGPLKYTYEVTSFTSDDVAEGSESSVPLPYMTDVVFVDIFNKHGILRNQTTRRCYRTHSSRREVLGQEHFHLARAIIVSAEKLF